MKTKSRILGFILTMLFIFNISITTFASETNGYQLKVNEKNKSELLNQLSDKDKKILTEEFNIDLNAVDLSQSILLKSSQTTLQSNTGGFTTLSSPTDPFTWTLQFQIFLGYVLIVTKNNISRSWVFTEHALERLNQRFAGSYDRVARVLAHGEVLDDIKYGGKVSYYQGDAVSYVGNTLKGQMDTIKTLEDFVNLQYKLDNNIWARLLQAIDLWE